MSEQTFHIPNPEFEATRLDDATHLEFHKGDERLIPVTELQARKDALRYAGGIELVDDETITGSTPEQALNVYSFEQARAKSGTLIGWREVHIRDAA